MARGISRTPSQNAYRGTVGQTQTTVVHVTDGKGDLVAATVHTSIDALSDPELVERLNSDTLNTVRDGDATVRLAVPVLYHDPAAEVMVLVLSEAHRHSELDERIRLLERLRADHAAVPGYAKEFGVVFGAQGLRTYLEAKAQQALAARADSKELDRKKTEIVTREAELSRKLTELAHEQTQLERARTEHEIAVAELRREQIELERSKAEVERGKAEIDRSKAEVERSKVDLERMRAEARARVIAAVAEPATVITPAPLPPPPTPAPPPPAPLPPPERDDLVTKPVGLHEIEEIETSVVAALPPAPRPPETNPRAKEAPGVASPLPSSDRRPSSPVNGKPHVTHNFDDTGSVPEPTPLPGVFEGVEVDDEPTGNETVPAGADPLTTETVEVGAEQDRFVEAAVAAGTSQIAIQDGKVRLALVAGEQIARGLGGDLDVRVLLHRVPTYPLVVLLVGPPAALRTPSPQQLAVIPLEVGGEPDRGVLAALAKKFELSIDVIHRGASIRRVRVIAPLAENVAYIMRAADDHLRGMTADGETEPSFSRARDLVLGAGYDILGVEHPEASEFRDDKLSQLDTAQAVRRALAIARRFARPAREDYLVCARGYPLSRWRELRRLVLESAVAWGIWMGPELAQIAVSEGLARSRRDLIVKLDAGFEILRRNQDAYDIDGDAADDNLKAIAEEARALGVELRKSNGAIKSEESSVVSGSIERSSTGIVAAPRTTDDLIALLEDKVQRISAAEELCDRGDPRAAVSVIAAVKKMSRAEAVRILGKSVKFGPAAAAPLIEGLSSSKAFLRHGCALALALLRTEEGTHAVIEQLVSEPTEIWREIARAIGQVGPTALMPMAAHVGRLGDAITPQIQERVAWAMAHVGVRGGKTALDQMAAGQSVMAPIAKKALELHQNAARDEVSVRPGPQGVRDVTVNRAFSRRFFEALEADRPDVAQAALEDLDASQPQEVLDESDLIVEDEDEAVLDESDLIQT